MSVKRVGRKRQKEQQERQQTEDRSVTKSAYYRVYSGVERHEHTEYIARTYIVHIRQIYSM